MRWTPCVGMKLMVMTRLGLESSQFCSSFNDLGFSSNLLFLFSLLLFLLFLSLSLFLLVLESFQFCRSFNYLELSSNLFCCCFYCFCHIWLLQFQWELEDRHHNNILHELNIYCLLILKSNQLSSYLSVIVMNVIILIVIVINVIVFVVIGDHLYR